MTGSFVTFNKSCPLLNSGGVASLFCTLFFVLYTFFISAIVRCVGGAGLAAVEGDSPARVYPFFLI